MLSLKKLVALFLVLAVVAGCVFAGGSSEAAATETKTGETWGLTPFETRQTIRIAFFTGSPLSYPFLFADKLGVFDALNIDVEYTCFTGGPAMMEANASWDIGSCGLGGIALALAGIFRGEVQAVFNKATHICMECIGIG